MKSLKFTSVLIALIIISSSCAKIFYSPDADSLAMAHRNIAILPPNVSIAAKKNIEAEAIIEQQRTESLNFQNEIYAWMLQRKMQSHILQEIQTIETTNSILAREGYPENPISPYEMCELLGVDGVIGSNFSLSKPMSEGAAVAVGIIFGAWGTTNEVRVSLSIQDCAYKKLIFNYDHKYSGSIGSSPARLVDELMRQASRKMPYFLEY